MGLNYEFFLVDFFSKTPTFCFRPFRGLTSSDLQKGLCGHTQGPFWVEDGNGRDSTPVPKPNTQTVVHRLIDDPRDGPSANQESTDEDTPEVTCL